jgi:hypothetical protein
MFIHLEGQLAATICLNPGRGRREKPERWPPCFSDKLELGGRATASPTVDITDFAPQSHGKGKVQFGASDMTDFRGK